MLLVLIFFRMLECESPDRWEMDQVDSYQRKRLVLSSTLLTVKLASLLSLVVH